MELNLLRNVATALLVFIILDGIWLGLIVKQTYSRLLRNFKMKKVNMLSALIVYALMALGLAFFVTPRVITGSSAFLFGTLFGLVMYGIYDFTNFTLFEGYQLEFVLIDTVWGAVACGITSWLVFLAI